LTVDLTVNDISFEDGTVGILSLVPADELLVLVCAPVLTTVSELKVTLDSLVSCPGASVDVSVLVVKSTLTVKSVVLPLSVISVSVHVVTLTVTMRVTLEESALVKVVSSPFFLSVTSSEAFLPVTIVVATLLVSKLAFTVVEVVLKATLIKVTIVLEALTLAMALTLVEFSFSRITVVVGHLTPASFLSVLELTDIDFLVLSSLVDVLALAIEDIVGHCTLVSIALELTSSVNENALTVGLTINKITFIPAS